MRICSRGGGLKNVSGSWPYSILNFSTNKLLFDATNTRNRAFPKGHTIFL